MSNERSILTIGHSDHHLDDFIALLRMHAISAVADVRSMPFSRFNSQFNRDEIKLALKSAGIGYVFLGAELGARRIETECYVNGKARYDLFAKTPRFQEGLARIQNGSHEYRIALMCAERDPLTCHRAILVCRHLRSLGLAIAHILGDGRLEATEALERRLLKAVQMDGGNLFSTESEAIEQAYDIQSERIAFIANGVDEKANGN